MIWTLDRTEALLAATGLSLPLDPDARLRALEEAAEARPADQTLAEAVRAVAAQISAEAGLPAIVASVRRERLVRWDTHSATWDGVHVHRGEPCRVRALRPWAARDPVQRRALLRDAAALSPVLSIQVEEDPWPALVTPLPGPPLAPEEDPEDPHDAVALLRLLGTGLASLARWEAQGLGPAHLSAADLRDGPDGVAIVDLSPAREDATAVPTLARALLAWWGHAPETTGHGLLQGLAALPTTATEALDLWRIALAEHLAQRRHALARRHHRLRQADRSGRLLALIERLHRAVPPPEGRGALGVDLEGRVRVIEGARGELWWGPEGVEPTRLYHPELGFTARECRRVLRARAHSPLKPHLQARVGGEAAFTEAACQWIGAGLGLRTLRMLLSR